MGWSGKTQISEPSQVALRPDLQEFVGQMPSGEQKAIMDRKAVGAIRYLNERLPQEERVIGLTSCSAVPQFAGCIVLTDRRLIVSLQHASGIIDVKAVEMNEVRAIDFNPRASAGGSIPTGIEFGRDGSLTLMAGRDATYTEAFLNFARDRVNTSRSLRSVDLLAVLTTTRRPVARSLGVGRHG